MNKDKAQEAVQQAGEYYAALRAELNEKIPPEDQQGRFVRLFALVDMIGNALEAAGKELQ